MLTKFVIVELNDGLNSKTIEKFIDLSSRFTSSIILSKRGQEANAKNSMELLALSIRKSEELTIKVDGFDQIEAIEKIYRFLTNEVKK